MKIVAIYAGMAVFLFFVLAPFIEGFLVSLKPLAQLFSTPYSFMPAERLVRRLFHHVEVSVPASGRYIFNSFFISSVVTLIVVVIVVPAAYAFARFQFPGVGPAAGRVPRGQHVLGRRAADPAVPPDALAWACSTPIGP